VAEDKHYIKNALKVFGFAALRWN